MLSWQLASVALVALEGTVGLWLSVKTDAPPGATIACVSGAVFALVAAAGRWPRASRPALPALGRGARPRPARRRLRQAGRASDGRLEVVATTTQIGDWVREVGGDAVVGRPGAAAEHRPARVRAAAQRHRGGGGRGAGLRQRRRPRLLDRRGRLRQRQRRRGRRPRRRGPGPPAGRDERRRRRPSTTRTGGTTRATPRRRCGEIERRLAAADPAHRRRVRAQRRAPTSAGCGALDRGIARCIDAVPAARRKLVTDHDAFGYFAHRYGIEVVGAVIPSQTTQAQPSAKDLSELAQTDRSGGGERRSSRRARSAPRSPRRSPARPAPRPTTRSTATRSGRRARPAPPTWGWRRPTPTRWSRGFTDGRRGCRRRSP